MEYDEFFTDGDKPYSENLNDSLMLLDAFDVTVPCSMPDMFNNGDFSSSVNVTRKCGVALVTLKSVDSGITVGTDEISGTGTVVFRVYPNFNSFYKWSKIILEKSGTVAIGFKKADGTDITVTVASDGTIGDAAALKMLEEIDVVLTLDDASISNILIWFVNNQGERVRTSALLEAEQLVNVDGTVVDNDLRAVSGDTVKGAFDDFATDVVDEKIADLSELKEDISNKVTSLDNSSSHYPSCSAVKSVTDSKVDKTWTKISTTYGELYVNESLKLAHFTLSKSANFSTADIYISIQLQNIPSAYCPSEVVSYVQFKGGTHNTVTACIIDTSGNLRAYSNVTGSVTINANMLWRY